MHIQASLLAPINTFWDEIDEGKLFSKDELEEHFGIPFDDDQYEQYFNKALDRQAKIFAAKEARRRTKEE